MIATLAITTYIDFILHAIHRVSANEKDSTISDDHVHVHTQGCSFIHSIMELFPVRFAMTVMFSSMNWGVGYL